MTRKQSLMKAIEVLSSLPQTDGLPEVITGLNELASDLPVTNWDEKTIFDTIEQFFMEHGKYPTTNDFQRKGLPSHTVIKHRFGITLAEFLDRYYPQREDYVKRHRKAYTQHSREHWLNVFAQQVRQNKVRIADEYNKRRTEGPGWEYIARLYGLHKWSDLVRLSGAVLAPKRERDVFKVISTYQERITSHELDAIQKQLISASERKNK